MTTMNQKPSELEQMEIVIFNNSRSLHILNNDEIGTKNYVDGLWSWSSIFEYFTLVEQKMQMTRRINNSNVVNANQLKCLLYETNFIFSS